MQRSLWIVMAALALVGCSGRLGTDRVSETTTLCHIKDLEREARCGTLSVPEDPANAASKKIDIAFVVIPAKARYKEPDAVFVLAGGPGQSARSVAGPMSKVFASSNARRDLVFVDQRGTGKSNGFKCETEDRGLPLAQQLNMDRQIAATNACKDKLPGDARHYITSTAVKDYDAVRAHLGYPQINLWGGSYGTRAALEYTRQFPATVRTLMLDGVAPASMVLPISMAIDSHTALMGWIDACEKDAACSKQQPDLRAKVTRLFSGTPVPLEFANGFTGKRETHAVDPILIAQAMRSPLYAPPLASALPHAVLQAAQGNGDPLAALAGSFSVGSEEDFSIGMHLSVLCAEDVDRIDDAALASVKDSLFGARYVQQYRRMCAGWPRGAVPAAFYEPVKASVPVLLLSGGLDPVTPPRHGELVAKWFANAQHLVAPNAGHIVSGTPCAPELLHKFIKSGGAEKLDGMCLAKPPRPLFYTHPVQPAPKLAPPATRVNGALIPRLLPHAGEGVISASGLSNAITTQRIELQ
jgi:pimeloyl-ACP methyl ester carboxylesterase